jgi:hypothetical protein
MRKEFRAARHLLIFITAATVANPVVQAFEPLEP